MSVSEVRPPQRAENSWPRLKQEARKAAIPCQARNTSKGRRSQPEGVPTGRGWDNLNSETTNSSAYDPLMMDGRIDGRGRQESSSLHRMPADQCCGNDRIRKSVTDSSRMTDQHKLGGELHRKGHFWFMSSPFDSLQQEREPLSGRAWPAAPSLIRGNPSGLASRHDALKRTQCHFWGFPTKNANPNLLVRKHQVNPAFHKIALDF